MAETHVPSDPLRRRVAQHHRQLLLVLALATLLVLQLVSLRAIARVTLGSVVGDRTGFSPGYGILLDSDAELERTLDAVERSGARWLRIDIDWSAIEAERGRFDWAATDRVVLGARERGLEVLALPAYAPEWARPPDSEDKAPLADPEDFAAFLRQAVAHYEPAGVRTWEIWNEPNLSRFWPPRPDPQGYAELLVTAAAAVREIDPDALVLSAGLAPAVDAEDGSEVSPETFLRELYDAGAAESFDAVALHPYSFPELPTDVATARYNTFQKIPVLLELMAQRGDGDKELWLTEVGAPTGTARGAVDEQRQSTIITQALRAAAGRERIGPVFVYAVRDAGEDPEDREDNFGLLRRDFSPKAAWGALVELLADPLP